ncbi:uncharacterized protein LOC129738584 isoform X1 [Uranotaenia lowii]|uniref:uncharacterized protein LOC129738584 isoform X1 n=1 Tax=Uranotaenia lowii TaxID=190385 RepID=UPI00247892CB|nr:uncharacterized protein LOC129738584 isoform X1 [Uranotaenia lowii]XP_055585796.1 uncharacterized protein LOC129738584 isoform X1 [Uranotaenia lowii]XP_055585797.1 uncharacterized protein LOC129738584 isoform X1 [Uranotaenia lowii]XP_055585798.1 uncharacterized protein LOC129738584 isoform X1 [Uranotaenia lowii]XP_055585799.1 uncharacterized protein LOC129738584 isoform X1 [Uranotaenia lowii]XP_055585800.1 uncharacterized protein LOC129738584 isoform X1 [Uranotaenia lowii]
MERIFIKYVQEFQTIYTQTKPDIELKVEIQDNMIGSTMRKKETSPTVLKKLAIEMINNHYSHCDQWYTDASKMMNKCGIGIYDASSNTMISISLAYEVNIATAELLAIRVALEQIDEARSGTVIFTDSQAACKIIKKDIINKQFDQITHDICTLATTKKVKIQWIPSHVGIDGNENADILAKQGLDGPVILQNKLRLEDAYNRFKQEALESTNVWYRSMAQDEGKGVKFYGFQPNFSTKPWYWNVEFNNFQIRTLNRLISGHDYSPYYLGLMRIRDTKLCELCNTNFTTEHALLNCIQFNHIRNHYDWNRYSNLIEMIQNFDEDKLREILSFLEKARMKI